MNYPYVRFDVCYGEHPFLIYSSIVGATLVIASLMQVYFTSIGDVLEVDNRGRVAKNMKDAYGVENAPPRWCISISETLLVRAARIMLILGSILATSFGWVCFPNPAYPAVITTCASALLVVGFTTWNKFEHEMATTMLTLLMLAIQLAECIVFIRVDPRIENWVFPFLVSIQLILVASFGLHVPLGGWISRIKDDQKRTNAAWWERERLTLFEWLNVIWFIATNWIV